MRILSRYSVSSDALRHLTEHPFKNAICQKKDWRQHEQQCNDDTNSHEPGYETIRSYDNHFADGFLSFALVKLAVQERFGQLSRDDFRRAWSEVATVCFLHVYLVVVENPPPGRFNRLRFHSVRFSSPRLFEPRLLDFVYKDLDSRFPAFTLGYSIVPGDINEGTNFVDINPPPTTIETFTHQFPYPLPPQSYIDPCEILTAIALREYQSRQDAAASAAQGKNEDKK
ncbi:hypothetical protein CVT26_003934 [Gymnopilus dilepis]|uniref:Uncharacterized protein n=1 Tax=Gymnopilus dilepis TaxID=231916 RepID=A0A409WPQ6_9AGAR|nr:hypothetical protein CVT26_003934 [Gymnopilus dilepis]